MGTSRTESCKDKGNRSKYPWTVIYLSTVPWKFIHQRMHAICSELAGRGHEVYFVDPLYSRQGHKLSLNCSKFSFSIDPGSIIDHKDYGVKEVVIPRRLQFGRFKTKPPFVGLWITRWLKYCIGKIAADSSRPVITIASSPVWSDIIFGNGSDFKAFDFIDDSGILSAGTSERKYREQESSLVGQSDAVLVTADSLREYISRTYPGVEVLSLPNAVDFKWFVDKAEKSPSPEKMSRVPRPVVGFIGALYDWIDMPLLMEAVRLRPDISFVFVGYRAWDEIYDRFLDMPNVYYFEARPYDEIPSWVKSFDACIIPFADGDIAKSTDPKKLYEYLALGKPAVVSDNLLEMKRAEGLVYFFNGLESFLENIGRALKEDDPAKVRRRMEFAGNNSWSARVDILEKHIENALNGSESSK